MGIETALFAALTLGSAAMKFGQAQKEAKTGIRNAASQAEALRVEGELAAKERSKELRYKAARQTSSFLNSGLTLEGTPQDVLGETYATGLEDITNIKSNYQTKANNTIIAANSASKNMISSARSDAISSIVQGFAGASFGGGASGGGGLAPAGGSSFTNNYGWVDWK